MTFSVPSIVEVFMNKKHCSLLVMHKSSCISCDMNLQYTVRICFPTGRSMTGLGSTSHSLPTRPDLHSFCHGWYASCGHTGGHSCITFVRCEVSLLWSIETKYKNWWYFHPVMKIMFLSNTLRLSAHKMSDKDFSNVSYLVNNFIGIHEFVLLLHLVFVTCLCKVMDCI